MKSNYTIHRKGMKIFRLESDWGEVIEGDANDLENLGFDSSQVRMAVATQHPYRGYMCSIIGVRDKSIQESSTQKTSATLEEFNNYAISQGKSYAQLQLEETLGRKVVW